MIKRILGILPIAGIGLFVLTYFFTSLRFPSPGYSHLHNYVCDLYKPENPRGVYMVAVTPMLTASLIFFWFAVSTLFVEFVWLGRLVRCTGAVAVLAASFIFTPAHDVLVALAVPLGVTAIVAACVGLGRKREWGLFTVAILAVLFCTSDFLFWILQVLQVYQPVIQKTAFVLLFSWIVLTMWKVLRIPVPVRSD